MLFIVSSLSEVGLAELVEKDYVVRLETAERQLQPQNGAQSQ
ncbi:hypothetical protein ES703_119214 [subsurface metagenome]